MDVFMYKIQFLTSVACFPGLPIHLRSIMGRQGQEMGSNKSSFKIVLLPQNYELQGLVNFIAKSIALYYNKFSFLSKLTVFRANTQQQ